MLGNIDDALKIIKSFHIHMQTAPTYIINGDIVWMIWESIRRLSINMSNRLKLILTIQRLFSNGI